MNIDTIKALADILTAHGLTALEIEEGDTRIRITKEAFNSFSPTLPPSMVVADPVLNARDDDNGQSVDFSHLSEVKSPLVGVFYSAPSPDSATFVSIGSMVKKGDILCIIETMKLLNEIAAEQDGEIVDICVKNGDVVEYGQVLFKLH